ncbi:MAG: heme-binding protein [Planctomycetota bacterium]
MRNGFRFFVMTVIYLALAASQLIQKSEAEDLKLSRTDAAAQLDAAIQAVDSLRDSEKEIAYCRAAAGKVLKAAPTNVFVEEIFRRTEQTKTTDPRKLAKEWRSALMDARDILRFEIEEESPIPEGFPEPAPVGEIRLQQYPTYRVARTDMTLLEGTAFLTLFNHIKERDIAMTAPVELTYAAEGNATKKTAMSFMYRSTQQGRIGTAGKVQVMDAPAHMAISIGIRGSANKERVADARRRLEAWLQAHRDAYEATGPLRVLGYNSPFIAEKKQFSEVQIPVRAK